MTPNWAGLRLFLEAQISFSIVLAGIFKLEYIPIIEGGLL